MTQQKSASYGYGKHIKTKIKHLSFKNVRNSIVRVAGEGW